MEFDKEKIQHLAKLCRMDLTEEEKESFAKDLNKILDYVNQIKDLELDCEPFTGLWFNDFREDEVFIDEEIRKKIIENFPEKEGEWLKVPPVLR